LIQEFPMRGAIITLFVASVTASAASAAVPNDFDNDGISDLTRIEVQDDQSLLWKAVRSSDSTEVTLGTLGQEGDHLIMGQWLPLATQIGVVSEASSDDSLVWKILDGSGGVIERVFGKKGDLAVSGADFNGNGVGDAAVARLVNKRVQVEVAFDLFVEQESVTQTFQFGKAGDRVFFMRLDASGVDWFGVVGKDKRNRADARMKNLVTQQTQRFRSFPVMAVRGKRPRPFAVRQDDGTDAVAFETVRGSATALTVFTPQGTRLASTQQSGLGIPVVGNFSADSGYEIMFQGSEASGMFSPATGEVIEVPFLGGVAVDEINLNVVGSAPTPIPNPDDNDNGGGSGGSVASCSSVLGWPGSHVYKTIGSTHFSPGDVRRNTIGLVIKPGGRGPFPSCIKAVDSDGKVIAQLGLYSRNDGWAARYYAGIGCGASTPLNGAAVASRARANTGSSQIYLNFDGMCFGPINASTCVGSSQC
jgi:hypothetical protein